MKIINATQKNILVHDLQIAEAWNERTIGLIGKKQISEQFGLWIKKCNSIHTCFMNFPIDAVFVNQKLVVCGVVENLKPWRMTWPNWRASSVIELCAGSIQKTNLKLGDQLNVSH